MSKRALCFLLALICLLFLLYSCDKSNTIGEAKSEQIYRNIINRELITTHPGIDDPQLKEEIENYNHRTTYLRLSAYNVVLRIYYDEIPGSRGLKLTDEEQFIIGKIADCMMYENFEQYMKRDKAISHIIFGREKDIDLLNEINSQLNEYDHERQQEYLGVIDNIVSKLKFNDEMTLEYIDKRMLIPRELIIRYSAEKQEQMNKYNNMTINIYQQAYELAEGYADMLHEESGTRHTKRYTEEITEAMLYEENANIMYNSSLVPYFCFEIAGSGGAWPRFMEGDIENIDEYYQVVEWLYTNLHSN